jgi:hypothetical protein
VGTTTTEAIAMIVLRTILNAQAVALPTQNVTLQSVKMSAEGTSIAKHFALRGAMIRNAKTTATTTPKIARRTAGWCVSWMPILQGGKNKKEGGKEGRI